MSEYELINFDPAKMARSAVENPKNRALVPNILLRLFAFTTKYGTKKEIDATSSTITLLYLLPPSESPRNRI